MQVSTYCVALALQFSCRVSEGCLVLMLSLRDCGFVIDIDIDIGIVIVIVMAGSINHQGINHIKSNTKQQTKTAPLYLG